jgi:hypothetical protein
MIYEGGGCGGGGRRILVNIGFFILNGIPKRRPAHARVASSSAEVATQVPTPNIHTHITITSCGSNDPRASDHWIEQTDPEASEASVLVKDSQLAGEIPVRRCLGLASQASTLSTTALSEVVLAARPLAFDARRLRAAGLGNRATRGKWAEGRSSEGALVIVRVQLSEPRSVSMVSFLALAAATEEGNELKHLLLRISAFSHSSYSRLVHSLRSTAALHCCDARALSDTTRAASTGGAAAGHGVPARELPFFSCHRLLLREAASGQRDVGVGTEHGVPATGKWCFCASAGALKKALWSLCLRALSGGLAERDSQRATSGLEVEQEVLAPACGVAGALLRWGLSERVSQRAISGLSTWLGFDQEVAGTVLPGREVEAVRVLAARRSDLRTRCRGVLKALSGLRPWACGNVTCALHRGLAECDVLASSEGGADGAKLRSA